MGRTTNCAASEKNGHVLLEDIPGVGKTTLAVAFSKAMQLEYKRVQFTPDVLPSDLTGFSMYRREEERFVYQQGSVFCNLLLADEINRTSPKTQSALLEVMEERKVTVDGVTREVPAPFLVIATQNPAGVAGTQYLPEAQMDRFMVSLSLGYPDYESELAMAKEIGPEEKYRQIQPVLTGGTLLEIQKEIYQVYMKDVIYEYILKLVRATRSHPYIERGASPRATIALVKMTKFAFLALLFWIYYIAGMYESPALMVLFLTQLLLLPVMFLLSVYLKRHLTVSFAEKTVYAEQGLPFTWRLQAENSGRLPVSRFLTKIRISRIGRRVRERKKVQGSSECGIQTSEFRDVPEHCGIERFRAERVKVYDYLSLFSRTKEMEDEMKVIVFPRKYDMRIET